MHQEEYDDLLLDHRVASAPFESQAHAAQAVRRLTQNGFKADALKMIRLPMREKTFQQQIHNANSRNTSSD